MNFRSLALVSLVASSYSPIPTCDTKLSQGLSTRHSIGLSCSSPKSLPAYILLLVLLSSHLFQGSSLHAWH